MILHSKSSFKPFNSIIFSLRLLLEWRPNFRPYTVFRNQKCSENRPQLFNRYSQVPQTTGTIKRNRQRPWRVRGCFRSHGWQPRPVRVRKQRKVDRSHPGWVWTHHRHVGISENHWWWVGRYDLLRILYHARSRNWRKPKQDKLLPELEQRLLIHEILILCEQYR